MTLLCPCILPPQRVTFSHPSPLFFWLLLQEEFPFRTISASFLVHSARQSITFGECFTNLLQEHGTIVLGVLRDLDEHAGVRDLENIRYDRSLLSARRLLLQREGREHDSLERSNRWSRRLLINLPPSALVLSHDKLVVITHSLCPV